MAEFRNPTGPQGRFAGCGLTASRLAYSQVSYLCPVLEPHQLRVGTDHRLTRPRA